MLRQVTVNHGLQPMLLSLICCVSESWLLLAQNIPDASLS